MSGANLRNLTKVHWGALCAFVFAFFIVLSVAANVFFYVQLKVNQQKYLVYTHSNDALHDLFKEHASLLTLSLFSRSDVESQASAQALENNATAISLWLGEHYDEKIRYEFQTMWRMQTAAFMAYAQAASQKDNGEKAKQLKPISAFPTIFSDFFTKVDPKVDPVGLKSLAALYVSRTKTMIDTYSVGDYTTFFRQQADYWQIMNSIAALIQGEDP